MEQIPEDFAETLRENLEIQNQGLRAKVAEHLIAVGAISPTRLVKLASGMNAVGYANLRPTGLDYLEGIPVIHLLACYIQQIISAYKEQGIEIRAFGGVPMGGLIWSYRLFANSAAYKSLDLDGDEELTHFIANKKPKGEGPYPERKIDMYEGLRATTPANVILIEDVITTGGSAEIAIENLQNEGLQTVAIVTIVQRDDVEPVNDISGIPAYSLFRMTELVGSTGEM